MEGKNVGKQAWRQGDHFESCYEIQEKEINDQILSMKSKQFLYTGSEYFRFIYKKKLLIPLGFLTIQAFNYELKWFQCLVYSKSSSQAQCSEF